MRRGISKAKPRRKRRARASKRGQPPSEQPHELSVAADSKNAMSGGHIRRINVTALSSNRSTIGADPRARPSAP